MDDLERERGVRVSPRQDGTGQDSTGQDSTGQESGGRLRRFGWKAFVTAVIVVTVVWLAVAQRARLLDSLGLLAHANWWWVAAAVAAQAVSMGAMARQQRRLLGVGGSRISLAGVVATTYAGNAISVGLPLAGPAAATLFAMRRFVALGAEASVAGWTLAVSGVFSSFALVAVVAFGAVVSGSGLAVVSAAVGVLGGAVPLGVLLLSLRRPGPRRLVERLGTRLVEAVQKVSGKPDGDPEEIVAEQLEEVTALDPDPPTLWVAALLAALNWLADAVCLAFAILAVGGDVPWRGLLLAWAAGTAVASLGLTPGGLGVVEAALSSALIATGLVGTTAIAAVLVYRMVSLWLVLAVGGLTLLGLGGPKVDEPEGVENEGADSR
jgi:putative heme transporter